MRSWLFVPGDQPRKLAKALATPADALILDLEDSVAPGARDAARREVLAFLSDHRGTADSPRLYVRINGLDTGLTDDDLDAVMAGAPDGIVLPKSCGGPDIAGLDARIAAREARHGIAAGTTAIVGIATESAAAVFGLATYAGASARLAGLAWGVEDLGADIGAGAMRADGNWTGPAELVRNLCLIGAAAAGVAAIDTVHVDFRDLDGLKRNCVTAARDGFSGKLAIHPDQVPVINEAFTPSDTAIARARRIVEALSAPGAAGAISLDGQMIDRPHLKAAERLLARAGRATRSR